MVVSYSCSAFISPRPLKREICQEPSRTPSLDSFWPDYLSFALVQAVELAHRLLAGGRHVDAEAIRN